VITIIGEMHFLKPAICTSDNNSLESVKSILHESALMKKLNHINVLPVLGISLGNDDEGGLPFIMLPYMANGDLKTYLKNKRLNNACQDRLPKVCDVFVYFSY